MRRRSIALGALLAFATGCWGGTSPMTLGPRSRLIETSPRPRRPAAWEVHAQESPPPPARPYADTPITEFAERITDFALAAAMHEPLSEPPIPTRRPVSMLPQVRWDERARPAHLQALAVAIEVELILKRGEPDDAAPNERWGRLRATIVVAKHGLRIVSLRPGAIRQDERAGTLPRGLEGLEAVARTLIADLRRGEVSHYALDERDRRLLANEGVWAQVHEDGPALARARAIGRMLEDLPAAPLAYVLDDIGVLARDEEGGLYALTLELHPHAGSFALSTTPLVSVRRIWPY